MEESLVTLQLPAQLLSEIESLASAAQSDVISVLGDLVTIARHRRTLGNDWLALCAEVRRTGGLAVGETTEEIVEQMRKTREEIFEAEYAHLYR
jgi:hypothetical protein